MPGVEPLAVILGAIVGGAAAILAPVIQRAWFRRDDQKRDHEQRRARRDELFFTHRLEVFARYMQTLSRTYEGLKALRHVTRAGGDVAGSKLLVQQHIDQLYMIETDIRLLAPEVVPRCSLAIELRACCVTPIKPTTSKSGA